MVDAVPGAVLLLLGLGGLLGALRGGELLESEELGLGLVEIGQLPVAEEHGLGGGLLGGAG